MPTRQGSIRLFQLFGINVYLHWSWFIIAYLVIKFRTGLYSSPVWNVLEYLSLFAIVLMHEFGHALACRQVGGQANQIVLWPLGGVAYVSPPQRPGAMLWSIAAGPLVNVALFPIFSIIWWLAHSAGWQETMPNAYVFAQMLWSINTVLLVFNMLPIYPLDGGQILRSLLWFVFGRANSLLAASIVGFIGVALLIILAVLSLFVPGGKTQGIWLGILCVFILLNCWSGLMQARALARIAKIPRRDGVACPACKSAPPKGAFWACGKCRKPFDTFETQGVCPNCGVQYSTTSCPECGSLQPISEWISSANVPPKL
jgi:Zn-dependent protease/RNA polymerase subunit RPABC4/transcription elongation factor Spt4